MAFAAEELVDISRWYVRLAAVLGWYLCHYALTHCFIVLFII